MLPYSLGGNDEQSGEAVLDACRGDPVRAEPGSQGRGVGLVRPLLQGILPRRGLFRMSEVPLQ